MTISAQKVARQVRFKLNDNDEVKYSDYDIVNAINEAIRYLNQNYALQNSDFLEKVKKYRMWEMNKEVDDYNASLKDGETPKEHYDFFHEGVELPDDFVAIMRVKGMPHHYDMSPVEPESMLPFGGYKVSAGRIFCIPDFDLWYRAKINEVTDLKTGEIDLPEIFFDCIVKLVCMILTQNPSGDVLMSEIDRVVDAVVPRRKYSNVKIKMPFLC